MRKLNLELPKFRLELNFRLVKRRKPLIVEPIIPTRKVVNRKYRRGTFLGKIARHLGDHKSARKIFAGNLAAVVVATSFFPVTKVDAFTQVDETVIETENPLNTQKGTQFPLENYKINQSYNFFHPGVDIGADMNDPIKAVKSGEVVEAEYSRDGYGNTVVINHGKGLTSRYAHLSKIEVSVGDTVTTDSEIGKVGITGHSTGPHLHLEIRQNGFALNPLTVIPK
jgi:murein DD-endopeptidase MepM/ murein hydrolase activator NlpD